MTPRRKLIEVALPLEAINNASAHEKSVPRRGHPATLHLWWARRPLAACRAVLFASLVDDPSSNPDRFPTPKAVEDERTRLFEIIERLVQWESTSNMAVLEEAKAEILRSTGGNPPPVFDPFCGGGSIPLEAQRLGLSAYASDLNPVAVLITKALIEFPPRFANQPPVHSEARRGVGATGAWPRATGLAEDVRRYGAWMRDEAEKRIGDLYPKVRVGKRLDGGEATVIAWLWARTVTCPNPACGARMPLATSFELSTKKGHEAWIAPVVDRIEKTVTFEVRSGHGTPPASPKVGRGASFRCLVCEQIAAEDHVKLESRAGRMGSQLMAVVAEGARRRMYLSPDQEQTSAAEAVTAPAGVLDDDMNRESTNLVSGRGYGFYHWRDLFTPRQLTALTLFSDLIGEVRERVLADATAANMSGDKARLADGGAGAGAYADAVATYLAFAISKLADWSSAFCSWITRIEGVRDTFARQAIPMVWDYVEINPLSASVGNFQNHTQWVADSIEGTPATGIGVVRQRDATAASDGAIRSLVSTDPPYYNNIAYADLSDFFYLWLQRSLAAVHPELFGTLLTPKHAELIAAPHRFGGNRKQAENHFESGLGKAFERIHDEMHPDYPVTVYYAFKQAESDSSDAGMPSVASTGWEKMLEGLLGSGLSVEGTWPMRTERAARSISIGTNALASSIILVCRPRRIDAGVTTRSDFVAALRRELPAALRNLQHGNIAPVDLAQASIGPGMAIFSRYAKVLEADGSPVKVRSALALINQVLDEVVSEQEGEFDADTRFAITWFSQYGFANGKAGEADVLARARNTSVSGLATAGIARVAGDKVQLLSRGELDPTWDPATDRRPTIWEATQHLVRRYFDEGSEQSAADLLARLGGMGETARDLAYRLYLLCDRKGWTDEARAYNGLVVAWPEISRQALTSRPDGPAQQSLDLGG